MKPITLWNQVKKNRGGVFDSSIHCGLYAYFLVYSYLQYNCESLKAKTSAERIKFKGKRENYSQTQSWAVQWAFLKRQDFAMSHRRWAERSYSLYQSNCPNHRSSALVPLKYLKLSLFTSYTGQRMFSVCSAGMCQICVRCFMSQGSEWKLSKRILCTIYYKRKSEDNSLKHQIFLKLGEMIEL